MKKSIYTLVLCLFVTFAQHGQTSPGSLEVTGTAVCEELPMDMVVTMPITIVDSTYLKCSKDLNLMLQDLKADLTSKGVDPDAITSQNYAISENYEYRQGQRIKSGFKGQVTVVLEQKYEPALVDTFLKTANKFKIQYAIRFMLSEEQKESLGREAMILAVKDATKKARVLAEASGVNLDGLSKISYMEEPGRPGPLVQVKALESMSDQIEADGLKLFPGKIAVKQSVFMVWNISR